MTATIPHFLLFSQTTQLSGGRFAGRWRFVLEAADGSYKFEAGDEEYDFAGPRLELLAVVRGLEALDQPSRVTLITPSRYVARGLTHGLTQWRAQDWQCGQAGAWAPVSNDDLWRRVDGALRYHEVRCRCWRIDASPGTARHRDWPVSLGERCAAIVRTWLRRWLRKGRDRRGSPLGGTTELGRHEHPGPPPPHLPFGRPHVHPMTPRRKWDGQRSSRIGTNRGAIKFAQPHH